MDAADAIASQVEPGQHSRIDLVVEFKLLNPDLLARGEEVCQVVKLTNTPHGR